MQRARPYNAAAHKHQQATPCVCDTSICAVLLGLQLLCSSESAVRNLPSIPVSAAAVCDRSALTMDGNVTIVWIKYQYLKCINISDVPCFFPETHPRNLDVRQLQKTPTLQPLLAAQAAAGHTTSVWQVRGVVLWLVALSEAAIRHQSSSPLSLFCCVVHACVVCLAHAAKNKNMDLW